MYRVRTERAPSVCLSVRQGDASAARMVVERRRRSLAASLRLRASAAADAADCLSIVDEARHMGLLADADELLQRLRNRQSDVQVRWFKPVPTQVLRVGSPSRNWWA